MARVQRPGPRGGLRPHEPPPRATEVLLHRGQQPGRVLHGPGGGAQGGARRGRHRARRGRDDPRPAAAEDLRARPRHGGPALRHPHRRDPPTARRAGLEAGAPRRPRAPGPRHPRALLPRRGPARPDPARHRRLAAVPHAGRAEPQPRRAPRPAGGRGRAAARGRAGPRAAPAAGAAAGRRGPRPRAARGRDLVRAREPLPGAGDPGRGRLPHRPRLRARLRRRGRAGLPAGHRGGAQEPPEERHRPPRDRGRGLRAAARAPRVAARGHAGRRLPHPGAGGHPAADAPRRPARARGSARRSRSSRSP